MEKHFRNKIIIIIIITITSSAEGHGLDWNRMGNKGEVPYMTRAQTQALIIIIIKMIVIIALKSVFHDFHNLLTAA